MNPSDPFRAVRITDRVVNAVIALFVLCALLVAGYAAYDQYAVVHAADSFGLSDDAGIYEKMMALRAANPDVKGWVYVEGTHINYPVLQGKDDWSYISKNYEKKDMGSGSIFIRQNNAPDGTDYQTILMGHNMNGGRMFGDVPRFKDKAFFNTHRSAKFYLPDRILLLEPTAFFELSGENDPLYDVPQADAGAQEALRAEIAEKSGVVLAPEQQLVTFSTCSLNTFFSRYVLVNRVTTTLPAPQ